MVRLCVISFRASDSIYFQLRGIDLVFYSTEKLYNSNENNNGKNSTNEDESFKCMFDFRH